MLRSLIPAAFALGLASFGFGCLGPSEEDTLSASDIFTEPDNPLRIAEILPDYEQRLGDFTRNATYLRGFAAGRSIWFWAVDGANNTLIAPAFSVVDDRGERLQASVIDVLPGDAGYTPWWRVVEYRVTDLWNGEKFLSREAIDAGERAGLIEGPTVTGRVLNAPVSVPGVMANDGDRVAVRTSTVWYRGAIADWIVFENDIAVPPNERSMRTLPVYVLQRIDEPFPLSELNANIDLTGDGLLNDSNNVFARNYNAPDYTPLWTLSTVRTSSTYVSIDTAPPDRNVGLSAEEQIFDPNTKQILSPDVLSVDETGVLLNCPIQSRRGAFP